MPSAREASAASETVAAADVKRWHGECDVLVVGFGAAGACAALGARQAGAEVLLLESYDHLVKLGGEDHQYVPIARKAIAEYYERWGKPELAAAYRETP